MIKDVTLRDTHIDWIPQIPTSWEILRSKYVFQNKSLKNNPNEPLLSVSQRDGVVVRSESDMNVWNPTDDVSGYKLIEPGDFVISLRSFEGGLELSKVKGIVSPAYTVLETIRKIDDHYFWWLMKSHQFIIELNKHVTGIRQGKNIGWDDFSNIYLTLPPLEEQKLISRYLDKKTNQIDSLINKIEKKIELLKEQRILLITKCVMEGINSNIQKKETSISWLGNIPSHWKLSKFKYIAILNTGNSLNEEQKQLYRSDNLDEIPYISSKDIDLETRIVNYVNGLRIPRENNYFKVSPKGSILMVVEGGSAGRKLCFLEQDVCFVNKLCSIDCYENAKFLFYFIQSKNFQVKFKKSISGLIGGVSVSELKDFHIPLPPTVEQEEIVSYLNNKISQIDKKIELENKKIGLIKEYRKSIISSLVTGKIRITEEMI